MNVSRHPFRLLIGFFVIWKVLLLLVAFLSPGIGYDTSTSLLDEAEFPAGFKDTATSLSLQILKLVRWDAIYFTHISSCGHVFEQEWAFGVGLSGIVSSLVPYVPSASASNPVVAAALTAIAVSHITHLLSVLTIFLLVRKIFSDDAASSTALSLVASTLHIVSPAGLFLSAPYTESLFSSLNMFGCFLYIMGMAKHRDQQHLGGYVSTIFAGLFVGISTIVRSNGILSGIPFLYDAILLGLGILKHGPDRMSLLRLCSLIFGGLLVAVGFVLPQLVAYNTYCVHPLPNTLRPWCGSMLPSIYTWVQSHYWNVGMFRYWSVSNIPLFFIALPALSLLMYSAVAEGRGRIRSQSSPSSSASLWRSSSFEHDCLVRLALPQGLLALLALTSYHVQIITRLSSGYAVWYIWLARRIFEFPEAKQKRSYVGSGAIVKWVVIYGVVQAGLFASFLPPA